MTIGKDVRLYDQELPDCTLDRKRTAVNFGSNSFHNNPYPPFRWEHPFLLSRFETKTVARSSFEKGSSVECTYSDALSCIYPIIIKPCAVNRAAGEFLFG